MNFFKRKKERCLSCEIREANLDQTKRLNLLYSHELCYFKDIAKSLEVACFSKRDDPYLVSVRERAKSKANAFYPLLEQGE